MTISEFAKRHNCSPANIHIRRRSGSIPASAFYRMDRERALQIDEDFFYRRIEFRRRVQLYIQEFLYSMNERISTLAVAKDIANEYKLNPDRVYILLIERVFRTYNEDILKCNMGLMTWKVFKYARKIQLELR